MPLKERTGTLLRNAARIAGSGLIKISEPPEEVSDDVLRERVKLAESVRRLIKVEEFASFHADSLKRINELKDDLVAMPAKSFEGAEGIELKGIIRGYQMAFGRLRRITAIGDDAKKKLEQRIKDTAKN